MGIFSSILDKIIHHNVASPASAQPSTTPPSQSTASTSAPQTPVAAQTPKLQQVDVEEVLSKLATSKGGGGNWRTSIVDLLKLLDLDSSLTARKTLAQELNVHAGADGSAEQNVALQKAVWQKLAENGGKVPDNLRQ